MSHLKEEIMNFKKITTIIDGSLRKDLEKNADLRYSPGMCAACNFASRILSWHFTPPSEFLGKYEKEKTFRIGTFENNVFREAFEKCSRINVELFRTYNDFISVRVNFYEKAEKESLLRVDAVVKISDGAVSVIGGGMSRRL